jgi:hypothetical protein
MGIARMRLKQIDDLLLPLGRKLRVLIRLQGAQNE